MGEWETLNCHFHPERIALERCEVCGKPLCAYCLYYTDDGQRLCAEHAEAARALGVTVDDPGTYADQLIGAQIGAARKHKRSEQADDGTLYKGNSTDLMSLIGMLLGVVGLGACCGAAYCMPLVAFGLSITALLNANKAHDKARTRRLGLIGLITSGVLVLAIVGCIALYALSFAPLITAVSYPYNWYTPPAAATIAPTLGPTPTATPAVTLPEERSRLGPDLGDAVSDVQPVVLPGE